MVSIADWVNELGGMARKRQLVRRGARDHHLTAAVRSGEVVRARNGWYSTIAEDSPRLRAVRVGGRLTGLSALNELGAWILDPPPLQVSVHENSARLRTQWNRHKRIDVRNTHGVVLHWDPPEVHERGTATTVGLIDALERVVLDESFETAVAALDWALHSAAIDRFDFETLILRLPAERRGITDWVDETCDSLPESLARTRLRQAEWSVETQVPLGDLQRIDLVVEDNVGIEVDGEKYHAARFEYDRGKDLDITIDHKHALRPSARAVFTNWPSVLLAVDTALADRGIARKPYGNSGERSWAARHSRGISGWRRRPPRGSPEFPSLGPKTDERQRAPGAAGSSSHSAVRRGRFADRGNSSG